MRDETKHDEATPVKTRAPRRKLVDSSALSAADPQTAIDERTAAEVVLGIARITLTQKRARGEAPPHFKIGRNVRYRLADVLAWRDARTVGKRAP